MAAMKMLSVISNRDITPGDVQAICLSMIVFAYRKAGGTKSMASRIVSDITNKVLMLLHAGLPEEGGEK